MFIEASQKMSIFPESIFGPLKTAANEKATSGKPIYDLSLGSPDLAPHPIVKDTLSKKAQDDDAYGYTLGGTTAFQQAVTNYYKRRSNVDLNPDTEVLQTMGSQEGLVHLPFAFCNPGDIVLTTNPAYIAYEAGIKLAGAEPYYMPLKQENTYLPDLESIPTNIAKQASLIILNLPGNPVPAMPTTEFFQQVVAFAKKYEILVLHDAAYSEYYFSGDGPMSFLSIDGAKEVGLEINSLSKSFSLAGARIAYLAGNKKAIQIMREFKSNLDYGIFAPIQEAAVAALDNAEKITDELRQIFSKRHSLLTKGLTDLGWEVAPSNGGMFIWAKYPFAVDDKSFVFQAIKEVGVVMIPGSIFGSEGKGYVRIALVQDVETLKAALRQLGTLHI